MYPSQIEKLVNSYKTTIPNRVFKKLKEDIVNDVLNEEPLDRLEKKLNDVIGPELQSDKYYKEIKGALKTDIINRVTGFTHNIDYRLREPVNNMINNTITNIFNNNDVVGGITGDLNHMKQHAIGTITNEVNNVIGSNVRQFTGKVINKITDSIYNINDPTGTTQMIGNFLNNTINGIGNGITSGIQNLMSGGSFDGNLLNNIESNLQNTFNGIKGNLVNQANNFLQKGINNLSNKIGTDISSIFSTPTIGLDSNGNLNLSGGFGLKDGAINKVLDKALDKAGLGDLKGVKDKLMDKLGNKAGNTIGSKEKVKAKAQDYVKNKRADTSQTNNQKKEQGKAADPSTKSPKDRNNKDNKKQQKDSDEPQEEQYNNDIPPRAKVKGDPRRDNCQELVLWEGKEKYVLLRDGKGNYIEFNEDKNDIRIQHTSGSFIQFRSSGDIILSSKNKIFLNCEGARYIKKF